MMGTLDQVLAAGLVGGEVLRGESKHDGRARKPRGRRNADRGDGGGPGGFGRPGRPGGAAEPGHDRRAATR